MKSSKLLLSLTLVFTLAISFISCEPDGPVFEKYLKLKNSTWDRFDQKFLEIPIENAGKSYDITFVVRTNSRFVYDNFPVYIILTSPSGGEQISEVKIPLRENGKMIGLPAGNLYEVRTVLWKTIGLMEKGIYKVSIENMIPKIQTEGINEIGIVVIKSE